jgi:hypothetical protein
MERRAGFSDCPPLTRVSVGGKLLLSSPEKMPPLIEVYNIMMVIITLLIYVELIFMQLQ